MKLDAKLIPNDRLIRLIFAALLGISVFSKVELNIPSTFEAGQTTQHSAKQYIATFLTAAGFLVEAGTVQDDLPFVAATTSQCHILIAIQSPEGWSLDTLRRLSDDEDEIFFVYNKVRYATLPGWNVWIDLQRQKIARYIGVATPMHAVLGVVLAGSCEQNRPEWDRFDILL